MVRVKEERIPKVLTLTMHSEPQHAKLGGPSLSGQIVQNRAGHPVIPLSKGPSTTTMRTGFLYRE